MHAMIMNIAEKHCNQPHIRYAFVELQITIDSINKFVSNAVATEVAMDIVAILEVTFLK